MFHHLAVDGRELWVTGNVVPNAAAYIGIEYGVTEIIIHLFKKISIDDKNNLTTMIRPVKAIHKKPCLHEEIWFSIE